MRGTHYFKHNYTLGVTGISSSPEVVVHYQPILHKLLPSCQRWFIKTMPAGGVPVKPYLEYDDY